MALNYTELGQDLGKLIKHYDLFKTDATNLDTDRAEIFTEFEDLAIEDTILEGLASDYEAWQGEYVARRAALANYALSRLQDRATVLDEVGAVNPAEAISRLIDQMNADSETVNASSVSLGAVSTAGNTGNGTVVTSKVLDGFSSPGNISGVPFPEHAAYKGLDSELCVPSETMLLECVADSFQDGTAEGSEQFEWRGGHPIEQHGIDTEGSGLIGTFGGLHENSILANLDFENFTSDVPDSWDLDAGTASTHVLEETTASDVYHGSSALQLTGDAAQANIQISQSLAASAVEANRMFVVTARVKGELGTSAGTLTIQFEGTGYTAGSTEKIEMDAAALAAQTSYGLEHFFVIMPASIPSDFELVIKWTGTPSAHSVRIDDLAFGPAIYGGGVAVAIVRGSTPWIRGDKASFTVTNTEGTFQRFFRRAFGYQLPSLGDTNETFDDAWAA